MGLFTWLTRKRSVRGLGLSLYKRGMTRANRRDSQGAMEDYTAVIDLRGAPTDLRAMALYNRALLHAAAHDVAGATDDLNNVLAMSIPLPKIKSAARQKLGRMLGARKLGAV